jgi:hypothetical protein
MGYLNNSVVTVDAILTDKGRELLAKNDGTFRITQFDLSDDELSKVMDTLDNMGTNPFRYFSSYESVNHLVSELPYRPEVLGVVDVDSRLLRYGHWGKDFKGL